METSPTIKEIATALTTFQKTAPNIKKDGRGNYRKYATLDTLIETIREPLAANKLSYVQLPDTHGLTTILMHESGEWIKATAALVMDKQSPQGQGSAITYMRRYALSAALGLATEDDDDGNEASKPTPPRAVVVPVNTPQKAVKSPTAKETKKTDTLTAKKLEIVARMKEIRKDWDIMTDEGKRAAIHAETDLEPTDENLPDIIARLEATLGK